jgi:hypothetical protein
MEMPIQANILVLEGGDAPPRIPWDQFFADRDKYPGKIH